MYYYQAVTAKEREDFFRQNLNNFIPGYVIFIYELYRLIDRNFLK